MKKSLLTLWITFFAVVSFAQQSTVDTISIYSTSNQKRIKAVVIKPAGYSKKGDRFPVVYLLHGYSGDYSNWILKVPALKEHASFFNTIIVCPNGENSWYINSPVNAGSNFETFVSNELVKYIDSSYRTIADRKHRAIAGLSMGGHGALMLGLRHKDQFGAAGSMSGALDLEPIIAKYNFKPLIGDTTVTHFNWREHSVMAMADSISAKDIRIIFDCGNKDIFISENRRLHEKLLSQNVPHDYIERAGAHNWPYWANAVGYQLLFFRKFFDE